ncbi:uncharacterized protein [Miscanthus floridulus]|uniref:uncharacterized protein n=1 Tax=Miscanthus floridulus TaxID=154761 RepID=UPI00345B047D
MAAARTAASMSAPRRPHPPASGDGHRRREGERGRRWARISPPPPPSPDLRGASVGARQPSLSSSTVSIPTMAAARTAAFASAPRRPHPPASGDSRRRREGERGRRRAWISPPPPPLPDLRGASVGGRQPSSSSSTVSIPAMAAAQTATSASAPCRPHPPASGDGHRRREGEHGRLWARISPPPPPSPDLRGAAVRQRLVRRDGMP